MCTAFVKKGSDLLVGFNFDLEEGLFAYDIYPRKDMFYVGITVGATTYKTHGVNRNGNTGNLPYMNAPEVGQYRRGAAYCRLDLLNDRYIAGKLTYGELLDTVREKTIVNCPGMSMHTQFTDAEGHILLVEPGLGFREVEADASIIANFPALDPKGDFTGPFYGFDRYQTGRALLKGSGEDFGVKDALYLLAATAQEGRWATRVSYVYSRRENAVYYVRNRDFSNVRVHRFEAGK